MSHVFVIQRNGGCEGYSGAIAVCRTIEEARKVKKILTVSGESSWSIFCAPMWPEDTPEVEWFQLKPLGDDE